MDLWLNIKMTFAQTFSSSFPEEKIEVTISFPLALASEQRFKSWAAAALSSEATNEATALELRRC